MSDQNNAPLNIDLDLSQTKTSVPIIVDGHMARLRLKGITQQQSDKGQSTKWEYVLVEPAPTTTGATLNPGDFGSSIFENIQLYAKPDAKDPQWFYKKISTRMDALLGTGDIGNVKGKPERPPFNAQTVASMIGKEMIVKMKVKTGEYEGNEFATVTFPGDLAL